MSAIPADGLRLRMWLLQNTSGLTAVASLFAQSVEPSTSKLSLLISFQSGTTMVLLVIKPTLTTLRSSWSQSHTIEILLERATISSSWLTPTNGKTLLARSLSQPTPTSETKPRKFSTPVHMKSLGLDSSKNTLLSAQRLSSPPGPLDGPRMVTPDLRAHTIALLALTTAMEE